LRVTASDGTNKWNLSKGGSGDWIYSSTEDESIAPGAGVITFTVDDQQGHTVEFKQTFFMPLSFPDHVSPLYGTEIEKPESVTFNWTAPAYTGSFIAVTLSKDPYSPFGSGNTAIPPFFMSPLDTTLTVPTDFGMKPSFYFWSLMQVIQGYDCFSVVLQYRLGDRCTFNFIDPDMYTVSGMVTQSGGDTQGPVYVYVTEPFEDDALQADIVQSLPSNYTVHNLSDGTYHLKAFRDSNSNLLPDIGTEGTAGIILPIEITVSGGDITDVNIDIQ